MTFRQFQSRFGTRLASLRVEAGLSQEEAARRAGITRVHWQRLESELPNPTVETLFRVAKVFGVPPGELLSAKR